MSSKSKCELLDFVNNKITGYGKQIVERGDANDSSALGELTFYISLRNTLKTGDERSEVYERGMLDGITDTLKFLEAIPKTTKAFTDLAS